MKPVPHIYTDFSALTRPRLGVEWWILLAGFVLLVALAATAQISIVSLSISTNMPAFDFSAATPSGSFPATGYFHNRTNCNSATFTIVGEPGVYDLQWNYALGNPRFTTNGNTLAIEGHNFVNVYPPITNSTGTVTVTYPAKPSPVAFWRLKKR